MGIAYRFDPPDVEAYYALYQTTGWDPQRGVTARDLGRANSSSPYLVAAYEGDRLVGFGRVMTDGVLHAMIYEMIVHPDHQGKGIGTQILSLLVDWCRQRGIRDIQLFCARGKQGFYEKNGFVARPEDAPGMQYRPPQN